MAVALLLVYISINQLLAFCKYSFTFYICIVFPPEVALIAPAEENEDDKAPERDL
jgi:hypothetical protein